MKTSSTTCSYRLLPTLLCLFCTTVLPMQSFGKKIYQHRDYDFSRAELFAADLNNNEVNDYLTANTSAPRKLSYELIKPSEARYFNGFKYDYLEGGVRIDPNLNFSELRSLNSTSNQLMSKIQSCSAGQSIRLWYSNWNFDSCPELKPEIDQFKLRVFNFILNSKFSKVPGKGILSYTYVNKAENSYLQYDDEILSGEFYEKDYLYSTQFIANLGLDNDHFSPLLIQTLIEISSLQYFSMASVNKNGKRSIEGHLISKSWWESEPDFKNLFALLQIVDYMTFGDEKPSACELLNIPLLVYKNEPYMYRTGAADDCNRHPDVIINTENDMENIWSQFPNGFRYYYTAAFNSVRLLANISFFVPPKKFGIFPEAAALYFFSSLRPYNWDKKPSYKLMGPFTAILTRNLRGHLKRVECVDCPYNFDRDKYYDQYRRVEAYRFYMKDLFPDLEELEFD